MLFLCSCLIVPCSSIVSLLILVNSSKVRQVGGQVGRQVGGQTNRSTNRQTDRQTDKVTYRADWDAKKSVKVWVLTKRFVQNPLGWWARIYRLITPQHGQVQISSAKQKIMIRIHSMCTVYPWYYSAQCNHGTIVQCNHVTIVHSVPMVLQCTV